MARSGAQSVLRDVSLLFVGLGGGGVYSSVGGGGSCRTAVCSLVWCPVCLVVVVTWCPRRLRSCCSILREQKQNSPGYFLRNFRPPDLAKVRPTQQRAARGGRLSQRATGAKERSWDATVGAVARASR